MAEAALSSSLHRHHGQPDLLVAHQPPSVAEQAPTAATADLEQDRQITAQKHPCVSLNHPFVSKIATDSGLMI